MSFSHNKRVFAFIRECDGDGECLEFFFERQRGVMKNNEDD